MCRHFSQTYAAVLAKLVGVTFVARLFSVMLSVIWLMLSDLYNAIVLAGLGVLHFSCQLTHIVAQLPMILLLKSCNALLNALTGCDNKVVLLLHSSW